MDKRIFNKNNNICYLDFFSELRNFEDYNLLCELNSKTIELFKNITKDFIKISKVYNIPIIDFTTYKHMLDCVKENNSLDTLFFENFNLNPLMFSMQVIVEFNNKENINSFFNLLKEYNIKFYEKKIYVKSKEIEDLHFSVKFPENILNDFVDYLKSNDVITMSQYLEYQLTGGFR